MVWKIVTWNVNSIRVRLEQVLDWLDANPVDVLALQELKVTDDDFPLARIEEAGYHAVFSGQKTYNGVALISKQPLTDVVMAWPNYDDPQKRLLAATTPEGVRVINVYIPNGSEVGSEKYEYKLTWLGHLTDFVQQALKTHEKVVLLGDFNIAPADRDVYDAAAWKDRILCSKLEREAYERLLSCGLEDTLRNHDASDEVYTWWDYRTRAFRDNRGLRIDHILASKALAATCQEVVVDTAPRKLERPSDHAPVIASFDL